MDEPDTVIARGPRRQVLIAILVTAILGITLGTGYALNLRADDDKSASDTPTQDATDEDPPADEPTDGPTDEKTDKVEPPADSTDTPSDKASEPTEEAVQETLSDDYLVTVDRIPAVPGLGSWVDEGPQDVPTLTCQGDWLSSLDPAEIVSTELRAYSQEGAGGAASALVNVAVLEFSDIEVAGAQYQTALGWLEKCPATHSELGSAPPTVTKPVRKIPMTNGADIADAHEAHQVVLDVCLDGCDASLTEYDTIAHLGQRMVVVSYAEGSWLATTAEQKNAQAARAKKVTERAVAHGMWDFH